MTDPIPTDEELEKMAGSGVIPGKPFGYTAMIEKDAIRDRLKGTIDLTGAHLYLATEQKWAEDQRKNLTFSQRQDLARWLGLSWIAPYRGERQSDDFTEDELLQINDRLAGANDPVGQSILQKIAAKMRKFSSPLER